jgi:hypothetical protein
MQHSSGRPRVILVLIALVVMWSALAFAQGGATSSVTGTVTDTTGAVVPGADIVLTNVADGTTYNAISGDNGSFTIPALPPGNYTATVSLQGFKTVELKDIIVNVAVPTTVRARLELGEVKETVVVTGASEIVQTQATSVASTLTVQQIQNLPMQGRAAFDLVGYMPGVTTTTGSLRDGTINGLPQSTVNITLDGMNIQDNYAKSWDGMFTRVSPRLDAVEEATVSSAASGADVGGQGAAQVRFVTRSGTNRYQGSAYYYFRRDWMNTNTWFNIYRNVDEQGRPSSKPVMAQYQPGARFGGPIMKDRLFFFVNYEEVRSPGTVGNTRTIMSPASEQGLFQYSGGTVDLMALAARNSQIARIDPVVAKLLADVRASTSQGTVTTTIDPLTQSFYWQQPTHNTTKFPTARVDYNLTTNHRVSFSMTQNLLLSDPDTTNSRQMVYPGFPVHGLQDSKRYTYQVSLRSVLSKNMVNEFRYGGTGGATKFSPDTNAAMFSSSGVGDMNGYAISWSSFKSISNPYSSAAYSAREGSTRLFEDTLNWLKGRHSLSMGASVTRGDVWLQNKQHVPTITLGMTTSGDPADGMFTTANFPGASSTDLTNAKNLYAVLTGRVSSIGREARVGEDGQTYTILGESMQKGRIWQLGFFLQDGWRVRPDFTVNAGLRWEIQKPFYALNNSYSTANIADLFGLTGTGSNLVVGSTVNNTGNLFQPGVQQGSPTTYQLLTKNTNAYKTDWNNLAPSIGAAWTTGASGGFLHKLLGSKGDAVIRGGLNIAYQRGGMSDFTEVYGSNPGIQIDATRNLTNGNLGTLPVLFSGSNLDAPDIPLQRVYPMAVPSASSNVRVFDPNVRLPWALTGTFGIQRALSPTRSIELRFVHTDSHDAWTLNNLSGQLNYNEVSVVQNGFMNEFRVAQANLAANIVAGKGNTFAYTGAPGTSPLPIFLANFNGLGGAANSNDPSKYTGSGWTTSTFVQNMYALNPNPLTVASNLRSNATYKANLAKAGYPFNFWVVNPDVNAATVVTNGPGTRYNGIQLVFNQRFVGGFMIQGNYSYGQAYQKDFYSFSKPYVERVQTYTSGSASLGNMVHTLSVNWLYELPFGQGKRWAGGAGGVMNRIVGNWSFMGIVRVSSGRPVDFGNVRLVGFTKDELQGMLKIRMTTDPNNQYRTLVWYLPQDIVDNTVKAFSVGPAGYTAGEPQGRYFAPANSPACLETVSGYGDCGARSVVVTGPMNARVDVTFGKQIPVTRRVGLEFQAMVFNLFNRVNFTPGVYTGSVTDSYQVTTANDQSRTMQLAFRVNF